ncbi:MAG: DNA polymerase/3'-5' exonuclease PolX [Candidatus Hermodarchaeota archaeon]
MTKNAEVARALKEIAILIEVEGKDKFKPKAYMRAVRSVTSLGEDIEAIARRGELEQIPGVGKAIAEKIQSYLETDTIDLLEKLRERVPVKVMEIEAIPGVGPKTIKLVYDQLGVTDLESLEKAANEGRLANLKGMGKKTQDQIIEGIKLVRVGMRRSLLADAMEVAEKIEQHLQALPQVRRVEVAGSYRRRRETVGDLDYLVDADDVEPVMEAFVTYGDVADIIARGPTKSSIRLKSNLQVDLRVIPAESYGAGLQYFTGSVDHNVHLRAIAQKRGLLLNEYGLFRGDKKVAGADEQGIYEKLGLQLVPPELREDRGEVEAAQEGKLPTLLELEDIRGDLHSHTDASDGKNTLDEMLEAASKKGYEYYCVSDHTQSLTIANGMDEERVLKRIAEIDEINDSGKYKMRVLKGAEVDILREGKLDLDDSVLEQLDVVTLSVHSMGKDKTEMTERVCHALESKYAHILGHPTGRLLLRRLQLEIDLDAVFEAARKNKVIMELNAHPERLDLNDGNLRAATRVGLKIAINTDAHRISHLDYMRFGVYQARRGWITKEDVVNTYPLEELLRMIRK